MISDISIQECIYNKNYFYTMYKNLEKYVITSIFMYRNVLYIISIDSIMCVFRSNYKNTIPRL